MTRIGIRQLRDSLTGTIRRVRAGETFEITHDGVPVALLSPVTADPLARLVASGEAAGPLDDGRPYRRFKPTRTTASRALEDDRAGR